MKSTTKTPLSVAQYIQGHPKDVQKRLKLIRGLVKKLAPKAEEKISYGMPSYHFNGRLVYFAAFKNHIGLYPMASGIVAFEKSLAKYKYAKGSVQFPHDEPLPTALISKILKYRYKENSKKSYGKISRKNK